MRKMDWHAPEEALWTVLETGVTPKVKSVPLQDSIGRFIPETIDVRAVKHSLAVRNDGRIW